MCLIPKERVAATASLFRNSSIENVAWRGLGVVLGVVLTWT